MRVRVQEAVSVTKQLVDHCERAQAAWTEHNVLEAHA